MKPKYRYNIGDIFLSGGGTLLYVASVSCGPSELLNEGEIGTFYKLTFLNGKPVGKSTFVLEEKINDLVYTGVYIYYPANRGVKNEM